MAGKGPPALTAIGAGGTEQGGALEAPQLQPDLTGNGGEGRSGTRSGLEEGSEVGRAEEGLSVHPGKCSLRPGDLALWSSDPLSPWGHRRIGQALPSASHSRECQACNQPAPVISITLPVTQAESTRLLS